MFVYPSHILIIIADNFWHLYSNFFIPNLSFYREEIAIVSAVLMKLTALLSSQPTATN
jgi:hypothetical protein